LKDVSASWQKGIEWLDPPGGTRLRLRFSGPWQGKEVRWDATFVALATPDGQHPQSCIEIGPAGEQGVALTVGLPVACLDLPTVQKTIIMIRRYKRLQPGRHQFGYAT
jgi:hypothetical protein